MYKDLIRWGCIFAAFAVVSLVFQNDLAFVISALLFGGFAMSWSFFTSFSGYLNLGHVIFVGIAGYTSAILSYHLDWPLWASIPVGCIVGTGLGWLYLAPIHKRIYGLSFEMVSFLSIIAITNLVMSGYARPLTGGDLGLSPLDGFFSTIPFALAVGAVVAVGGFGYSRYLKSNAGKILDFAREKPEIVKTAGADPHKFSGRLLLLSGVIASLMGTLYVHFTGAAVTSNTFELAFMIRIMIMAIIGGRFGLVGSIVGAFSVVFLGYALKPYVNSYVEFLIIYAIGFAIYFVKPDGLMGIAEWIWSRIMGLRRSSRQVASGKETT